MHIVWSITFVVFNVFPINQILVDISTSYSKYFWCFKDFRLRPILGVYPLRRDPQTIHQESITTLFTRIHYKQKNYYEKQLHEAEWPLLDHFYFTKNIDTEKVKYRSLKETKQLHQYELVFQPVCFKAEKIKIKRLRLRFWKTIIKT